ncbi:transglycosylase SLT domain-containing protein [Endozoicomonas sp. G2_2]|uniref:transglycosylase SLT domain-containing protein n=1 Tax=Endozoicomonas sp. G2_2 TaxID=2821092 RepID=UPI001ADC4B4C|nr:transglycosylase SLT domain-containing protein [Endozoicomonas sp. G2_2]MBO9471734.1 transglycosylase SLT domain-containing protein [Endozoicomonas sp. G2_2]
MRRTIMAGLVLVASISAANAESVFESAGELYGVDPTLLRSISMTESSVYPWTLNFGGNAFYLPDREAMVRTFKASRSRPWLVTVVYRDKRPSRRIFFKHGDDASAFGLRKRADRAVRSAKVVHIDIDNVDIGLMQVNWRWHGKEFSSIDQMSQTHANVMYAAQMLRSQIKQYGLFRGVGYYHSRSSPRWRHYYRKVRRSYASLTNGS